MFWDTINLELFKPFASPNANAYCVALWRLYETLVQNQLELDECTPKEAKDEIRFAFLEHNQQINYANEDNVELCDSDEEYTYRYLKKCGWLREIDDVGYRRVTFMPQIASNLLSALDGIKRGAGARLAATCQTIFVSINSVLEHPSRNAFVISSAEDTARTFQEQLKAMAASCRDIAYRMREEQHGQELFRTFFKEFTKEILLEDYTKLKTTNHPYRYRQKTLAAVAEILYTQSILDEVVDSLDRTYEGRERYEIESEVKQQLFNITIIFKNIDQLLIRIEEYRSAMTRRTREAMQYALTVSPQLSQKLDDVSRLVAQSQQRVFPGVLASERHIGRPRFYIPMIRRPEPEPTPITRKPPPIEKIAEQRAYDVFIRKRAPNPKRLIMMLEKHLQQKNQITTDDIVITTLDDFLAYLQLRDLLNGCVPKSNPFYPLLEHYDVRTVSGENTENQYLIAPKLIIRRKQAVATKRN
ncbi:Wadjet anti-phage system protein JetA family protein [Rheinheimera sp.]|uniref:Wadjet anti-phage system protein JetA family protein n=1 Tax=Rheinheimera sp. TaxID=1869214 RepID=UPI003AF91B61